MAFEIVGSRILAPFLGTSTYIWVAIISTILLAMSGGYYFGGKAADRKCNTKTLSSYILLAAAAMCIMNLGKNQILLLFMSFGMNSLFTSTISAFVLFTIPAFMLAAVFPYALRMALTKVENSGKVTGRFYAVSTFGSIAGTFLSATLLIPSFGTTNIIWLLATLLIGTGLLLTRSVNRTLMVASILLVFGNILYAAKPRAIIDTDSQYNRILIYDGIAKGREARYMSLNGHVNAGMWLDDTQREQLFPYSSYFKLAMHFKANFKNTLMLGAGGYSFPKLYQETWPDKSLTVVEIDPKLTELSEAHFEFQPSEFTSIFHQDARSYLSQNDEKFDVIINDVFTSPFEVPFHMTTLECYSRISERLSKGGILATNVLGSLDGDHSRFLKSQIKTLNAVFDHVLLFQVDDGQKTQIKNNILIAFDGNPQFIEHTATPQIRNMLEQKKEIGNIENTPILTDEYAPANWMLSR